MKGWPFKVISGYDDKPLIVVSEGEREKRFTAEEISSAVLIKMKQTAEAFLGCPVKRAVVTVPAYFNDSQRQSTKDAGTIAGLDIIRVINEPTAAALAYGLHLKTSGEKRLKKVLVFDLGGGTFDVSVLQIRDGEVEVKVTGGDTHLGVEDFDTRLASHFAQKFKRKHGEDIVPNPRAMRKLRTECERAKRGLTTNAVQDIDIDSLFDGIEFHARLTRSKFDDLNKDFFERCMRILGQCLADAHMSKRSIDDVILVGGSIRILKLQEMLTEYFEGKALSKSMNADEAIAYGAAIQAAKFGLLSKVFNDAVNLRDVAPLSLGTPNRLGIMEVFVPRNTRVPAEREQRWTLTEDNLTSTTFPIYEGEMEKATDNHFLGELRLDGITPCPAYQATINVMFRIDEDGILNVSARDVIGGSMATTTITNAGRLSEEEIDRMIRDANVYRLRDDGRKRREEAKCGLESYALNTLNALGELAKISKLPTEGGAKILVAACKEVIEWLEDDDDAREDVDSYHRKKRELEGLWDLVIKK